MAGTSLLRLQSDERLAELASAGHESAFDAIVDRYRTPLTRYCAGIVGPSRAEDAVQQALINAHDALQRTDAVRNLRPWLYRIAHNAALNVLRAVRDDAPLDERTLRGAHATASPAESFERSEEFRATLAALQALPERQRAALVLRELEGRSHEEIAAALGVTKGSARQHLMRARVAVRGAVTAVTPYPLIARLSEWASAGAGASAPGWVDAATTAGAGASLAKLTAGLAATGALVGGAVGTEHIVRGGGDSDSASAAPRAAERAPERAVKRAGKAVVLPATAVTPAAASSRPASGGRRDATSRSSSRAERRRAGRSAPRDGGSGGAAAPASASTPTTPSAAPSTRQLSGDHRSEKAKSQSSHGRETSASNRADPAAGKNKASKDDKPHKAKKNGKGDAPGQAKKTAPSTSSPVAPEGSDGKGSKGNGANPSKGNGSSGSDGKGSPKTASSGADDTDSAATTPATESPPASTPSPATADDD